MDIYIYKPKQISNSKRMNDSVEHWPTVIDKSMIHEAEFTSSELENILVSVQQRLKHMCLINLTMQGSSM